MIIRHSEILSLIREIRNSHSRMVDIFTKGSCLNLYFILKCVYKDAIPFIDDSGHILTKIDGRFYDINGTARPQKSNDFRNFWTPKASRRMFKEMYNNEAVL